MKRIAILLVIASVTGMAVFADEAVLIDFNKLVADTMPIKDKDGKEIPTQNQATLTDFSIAAGSSFTPEEKALMKTSLYIENWEVTLNSSAISPEALEKSVTKTATVGDNARKYAKEKILGIRAFFPTEPVNAVATIKPPFEIPAYADKETLGSDGKLTTSADELGKGRKFESSLGVVKNVGVIKSISVNVFGINFPHGFSVVLKDQNNKSQEYFLGYLSFDGWRTITWNNGNYVNDVRDREIRSYPLYPNSAPLVKIEGFKIYKDGSMAGGDFVGYVKDVTVVYDKAVLSLDRDINDELTWGILQKREEARRMSELQRLGVLQVERYLEKKKMDNPSARTTTSTTTTTQ